MQTRTDKYVRPSQAKTAQFTNQTKVSDWETLAQIRTKARLCKIFKACFGERTWKATRHRFRKPYYLISVDHVRKIRDRKRITDIGKYSFVISVIKHWNQTPAEALRTFPCKPKIFRNGVKKAIINGVK